MFTNVPESSAAGERKSLFPAYAARKPPEVAEAAEKVVNIDSLLSAPKVTDSFGWLKNSSYTGANVDALQVIQMGATPVDEKMEEDENEKHDEPVEITEIYRQIEAKHRNRKKKPKHKTKSKKRSRSPSPEKLVRDNAGKKIFLEEIRLAPEHAYRVDRNSDRNIVVFGAFAPIQIPRYVRHLRDILGQKSKPGFFPWWDNSGASSKKKRKAKQFQRYHKCRNVWINETDVLDLSGPAKTEFPGDTCRSLYLPIGRSITNTETTVSLSSNATSSDFLDTNPLRVYDKNTNLYFQGKGAATDELTTASSEVVHGPIRETHEEYLTRTTVDFNRHLRDNPGDIRRWIDFVAFQHSAVHVNQFNSNDATADVGSAGQKKIVESALLEKQLAILDKALTSNPASVELLVMKFNLCKETWEADRLAREWKRVVFVHPNNTWLWRQYLRFYQTTFSLFKVTKYSSLYGKCFATLRRIHAGAFQTHKAKPRLEEDMIEIFSDYCQVLLQSGYHEKAIANFQALIEYNFFAPETLTPTSPLENWMAFFEPFWDSGKPRFGDRGAKGWSDIMKNRHQEQAPEQPTQCDLETEESVIKAENPRWMNWLSLEQTRVRRQWLPWRSGNAGQQQEDECEDPDRMVLFDDVEPSLFRMREDGCRFGLVLRFLFLLGVRVEPHLASRCRQLRCHDARFVDDLSHVVDEKGWHLFRWRFYQCGHVTNVFEVESRAHHTSRTHREFVDDVFRQSLSLFHPQPARKVALVALWVQHRCLTLDTLDSKLGRSQLKEVKRMVKNILKEPENRNNLSLWKTYATLEWVGGNRKEARKIFDMALSGHTSTPDDATRGRDSLLDVYATYVELELGVGFGRHTDGPERSESWDEVAARVAWLLTSLANETPATLHPPVGSSPTQLPSTTALLKTRRQFRLTLDTLLEGETSPSDSDDYDLNYNRRVLISWTMCYGLFEYVTEGLSAADAIFLAVTLHCDRVVPMFDHTGDLLSNADVDLKKLRQECDLELLYMHYVQLHVLHSNIVPFAPITQLRQVLHDAMKRFPENEHFNQLFLDIEAKSHLAGRIRRHYNRHLRDGGNPGCTSATLSILAELEHQNNLVEAFTNLPAEIGFLAPSVGNETGITHRLHALFERIVTHKGLENCVLVWRLFMKFEAMQRKRNGAKTIFYRAIRQCPAAKILYMDAIEYCPNDLQEFHDLLSEKEIRVRIPLEEVDLLLELNSDSVLTNVDIAPAQEAPLSKETDQEGP